MGNQDICQRKKVAIDHETIAQVLEQLEFILAVSDDKELVHAGLRLILLSIHRDLASIA